MTTVELGDGGSGDDRKEDALHFLDSSFFEGVDSRRCERCVCFNEAADGRVDLN